MIVVKWFLAISYVIPSYNKININYSAKINSTIANIRSNSIKLCPFLPVPVNLLKTRKVLPPVV